MPIGNRKRRGGTRSLLAGLVGIGAVAGAVYALYRFLRLRPQEPVERAARRALRTGDLEPLVPFLDPGDEYEVSQLFEKARSVRELGADARSMADDYFVETVARLHDEADDGFAEVGPVSPLPIG